MRIGELAGKAGMKAQSIRFYERRRLLRPAPRTASGYRVYDARDLEVVLAIKQIQGLGFSLREIKQILDLHGMAGTSYEVGPAISVTRKRLAAIDEQMRSLRRVRASLVQVLELLQTKVSAVCPVARTRTASAAPTQPSPRGRLSRAPARSERDRPRSRRSRS